MKNFEELKVGDMLKCLNPEGWAHFKKGKVYTVTGLWGSSGLVGKAGVNIDLNYWPVALEFSSDFEFYEGESND